MRTGIVAVLAIALGAAVLLGAPTSAMAGHRGCGQIFVAPGGCYGGSVLYFSQGVPAYSYSYGVPGYYQPGYSYSYGPGYSGRHFVGPYGHGWGHHGWGRHGGGHRGHHGHR